MGKRIQFDTKRKPTASRWLVEMPRSVNALVQALFVNEALQGSSRGQYFSCEALQVAKYDPQGCFDFHHDGYNRFVTVLTYLNGIGGTYFPMAQTADGPTDGHAVDDRSLLPILKRCNQETTHADDPLSVEKEFQVGRDGLLVVGKEGESAYTSSGTEASIDNGSNSAVVKVQPGDALVFYNMKYRWNTRTAIENYRSMHAGLRAPEEAPGAGTG